MLEYHHFRVALIGQIYMRCCILVKVRILAFCIKRPALIERRRQTARSIGGHQTGALGEVQLK